MVNESKQKQILISDRSGPPKSLRRSNRPRQGLPPAVSGRIGLFVIAIWGCLPGSSVQGQLRDGLDDYPSRFSLQAHDCNAKIDDQRVRPDGGVDNGACEEWTLKLDDGTHAHLIYPIEPVHVIDDLRATIAVRSTAEGLAVGFRVRFPYTLDPNTHRPREIIIWGAKVEIPGQYQTIGIAAVEGELRRRLVALKSEYQNEDFEDEFIDGVVINAYSRPGKHSIRLDDLRVDGMVPVASSVVAGHKSSDALRRSWQRLENGSSVMRSRVTNDSSRSRSSEFGSRPSESVFQPGRVTKILEYRGEPLHWIRTLGFDALLLRDPPSEGLLREAAATNMGLYAAPPSQWDVENERRWLPLLNAVSGWYVSPPGGDRTHTLNDELTRLASLPSRYRRPILASGLDAAATDLRLADGIIVSTPPRVRKLGWASVQRSLREASRWFSNDARLAISVAGGPPAAAREQSESIAASLGAPPAKSYDWQELWAEVMTSLGMAPSAIIYRSDQALSSGSPLSQVRASSFSIVNRMVAMLGPYVVGSRPVASPTIKGANYHVTTLRTQGQTDLSPTSATDLVIAVSTRRTAGKLLAGSGDELTLNFAGFNGRRQVWRLTHFSAERLPLKENGSSVSVVSPDVVEVFVVSDDPLAARRVVAQTEPFARQASLDRLHLAEASLNQTRGAWELARRLASPGDTNMPQSPFLEAAQGELERVKSRMRAVKPAEVTDLVARADAWLMRSQARLVGVLTADPTRITSLPTIQANALELQTLWQPLMLSDGWTDNLLTSGGMEDQRLLSSTRWNIGSRLQDFTESSAVIQARQVHNGRSALKMSVFEKSGIQLGGGYAGTVLRAISPSISMGASTAYRIDAMVKTVGLSGSHQGILVYDTLGGPELGVLVPGDTDWTPIRLYRQTPNSFSGEPSFDIQVAFEVIGGGEAYVDDVTFRRWSPEPEVLPSVRAAKGPANVLDEAKPQLIR
ncbi:MAG: hypothetical protein AAF664_02085 [Planctomycetota bacterium]